jgi:hypothetical protein
VTTYRQVTYHDVYPGIDAVFHGAAGAKLEFDFRVAAGANPNQIVLDFGGDGTVAVDGQGGLTLSTPAGPAVATLDSAGQPNPAPPVAQLTLSRPVYSQPGARTTPGLVRGSFVALGGGLVGFAPQAFDPALPLVIDPLIGYATFLGGSSGEVGTSVAVDSAGASYPNFRSSDHFSTIPCPFRAVSPLLVRRRFPNGVVVPTYPLEVRHGG